MFNLILNENMKIYLRIRTWVLVAILLLGVVGIASIFKAQSSFQGDWKVSLEQQVKSMQEGLNSGGIPEFERKAVEEKIAIDQYALDHDINPNTMWNRVKDLSELISLITIFVVIIVGDIVAGEFTWGTIKLLLIRPVNRTKILLSKYLATVNFALFMLLILFVSSFVVSGIFFGFGDVGTPHLYIGEDGAVTEGSMLLNTLQTYGLTSIELIMIVTIAFMISTVFRSSSMAIGFSIFIMFTGEMIAHLIMSKYDWGKYILFSNTDLTIYLEGTPPVEGMTLQFSIIVLVAYFIVLNLLSWFIFNKRDVAA